MLPRYLSVLTIINEDLAIGNRIKCIAYLAQLDRVPSSLLGVSVLPPQYRIEPQALVLMANISTI